MTRVLYILKNVSHFVREACGENDYARYRALVLSRGLRPLSAKAFYVAKLERKYSRMSRCC